MQSSLRLQLKGRLEERPSPQQSDATDEKRALVSPCRTLMR